MRAELVENSSLIKSEFPSLLQECYAPNTGIDYEKTVNVNL